MEENPENQMETDVSSTTQDIPVLQEATGSISTMEVTIEVAETTVEVEEMIEDEQDKTIDSNTPESNSQTLPKEKETPKTPQKEISDEKESPNGIVIEKDPPKPPQKKEEVPKSPLKDRESPKTPQKENNKVPEKILTEKSQKSSLIQKDSQPIPKEKTPSKPVEQSLKSPILESLSNEIKTPTQSKNSEELPNKSQSTQDNKQIQNNQNEVLVKSKETSPLKDPLKSVTPNPDNKIENVAPNVNDEVVVLVPLDIQHEMSSTDSQETNTSASDPSEKEHNKSISRELKSLIASAKESKIISECTQLKSKTRKSRQPLDSSNSSLNTSTDASKIQSNRRESSNSQKSESSEKSEKAMKRSMRSSNPDFVNKQKLFLNTVTSKFHREDHDTSGDVNEKAVDESKTESQDASVSSPKKKKVEDEKPPPPPIVMNDNKLRSDSYCWRCHWAIEITPEDKNPLAQCTICPRSFHFKCLTGPERTKLINDKSWVCPKCLTILHAESSETRSPVMRKVSLGMLCDLLKYALQRMMDLNGVEPFLGPVDRTEFPDYDKYVVHPVDLGMMKENIAAGVYGSTEAFLSDAQWIQHNSIIFNTFQSKLTGAAKALVRSCRSELAEIEACAECYAAAHARRPTWFTDVCSTPHVLLWAKLKGFPYWPAKGMSVNSASMVDVRFFGDHDRAWVPARDCFLFSEKDPNNFRTKRQDIIDSMQEAEQHIRNITRKFGKFVYPAFKVVFEPSKLNEHLKAMIPGFEPETSAQKIKEKPVSTPSPTKSRTASKSSKDSKDSLEVTLDGEKSDDEESLDKKSKMVTDDKIASEDKDKNKKSEETTLPTEKPMEVDAPQKEKSKETEKEKESKESRKRRRSNLEEAVLTIMTPSGEKRSRLVSAEVTVFDKTDSPAKSSTPKPVETVAEEKPVASPKPPKESDKVTPRLTRASTPGSITKSANKQTPKVNTPKVNTPKEVDKVKKAKAAQRDTPTTTEKDSQDKTKKRDKTPKVIKAAITTPKVAKKNDTPSTSKDATKDEKSTPKSNPKPKPKSLRDNIVFDEETNLAVLSKKSGVECFPTITNVRSLSQTDFTKGEQSNAEANRNIFTTTATEQVSTMKDAVAKLQRLRNEANPPVVGRVGVRAFARMTSPPAEKQKSDGNVEVEVKAEPMDFEDIERQNEKLNLLNTIKLRPVNPPMNLREVRITKTVPNTSTCTTLQVRKTVAAKPPEVRPRARKTFPQPQKNDGRSELNSKNSMVYIPIQPPVSQAPVRPPARAQAAANGPVTAPVVRTSAPASSSNTSNTIVNTVTAPLMTVVSMPSLTNSSPTLSNINNVPNLTQMGNISQLGQLGNLGQLSGQLGNLGGQLSGLGGQLGGQLSGLGGQLGGLGGLATVGQVGGVHTVPLITSVNGQWTFSLQPMMSVGGVDRVTTPPPLMNGTTDPLALSSSSSAANTPPVNATNALPHRTPTSDSGSLGEPPRLVQKPGLHNPLDPSAPPNEVPVPSEAGPLTAKLNQNAAKLADFFLHMLEESIEKREPTSAQAQLTKLKVAMEKMQWRHKQEIEEVKHNNNLLISEMRSSFEKERNRLICDIRRASQLELVKSVKHAKSRQWCANCKQEAQYYCCWNTSYCDYPCQRAHWSQHFSSCTQQRNKDNGNSVDLTEERLQVTDNPPALQKPPSSALTVGGKLVHSRLYSQNPPVGNSLLAVNVLEDSVGNSSAKSVVTYSHKTSPPGLSPPSLLINKQIMTNEENASKKVVTSGGYLIVGASTSGNPSLVIN